MDPVFSVLSTHFSTLIAREQPDKLIVGLSGGLDSVVLLHGLTQLSRSGELALPSIEAVYVNHGLSANADDWQQSCAALCKDLNVSFTAIAVEVKPRARESLEACARDRRYEGLCNHAKAARRVIVTAHHQNDQLEFPGLKFSFLEANSSQKRFLFIFLNLAASLANSDLCITFNRAF